MLWSVALEAEGDREVSREEVVELADAVAVNNGVASGIGTNRYGAQLVIEALDRATADDYTTINGSGKLSTKPQMMGNLRQGKTRVLSVTLSDMKARIYGKGDVAVLTGDYRDVNVRDGVTRETHALFTRVFVKTERFDSGPDGATVDAEGFFWTVLTRAGKLARFAPDGTLERVVDLPVSYPTSLCFGGPRFEQVYLTTISRSTRLEGLLPHDGGLFLVEGLPAAGRPPHRFADR